MALTTDNPIYTIVYNFARGVASLFGRWDISGVDYMPTGACLLACNHQSFLDPPLVGCSLKSESFFFARKSLFKNPLLGFILRTCNSIPVDRDGGSDVAAFKRVFSLLKNGQSLLMFPEGTRSKDGQLQEAQAGIGLIACKTRVPVVPARVFGTRDILPRGSWWLRPNARLTVVFAPPMQPAEFDPGAGHPERFAEASRRIMERIAAIQDVPEEIA
ncbi:MAG: 1-acyl-sn-glycerol-3-phosphate acyltransferase [Puniceicoccales bacterium]|jgi:1-acyl-sn-glycerol-3-phosphate acyltransferase|nr:1-acyl-sn-glycerol-3-phosphate acyltransferase [Puniceicoccales bacterium]